MLTTLNRSMIHLAIFMDDKVLARVGGRLKEIVGEDGVIGESAAMNL